MIKTLWPRCVRAPFVYFLAGLMVQSPIVKAEDVLTEPPSKPVVALSYRAFQPVRSIEEAKVTIKAAESRPLRELNLPGADLEFAILVQANALTKLVDDPTGFLEYFKKNKFQLMRDEGVEAMNWQMFMAHAVIKFKLIQSESNPKSFGQWLDSVVNSELIQESSWKTWLALVGAFYIVKSFIGSTGRFVGGVAHGAMIAGPAAGSVNAFLNPLVTPINQWLAVKGIKWVGPLGMWINKMIWERKKLPKNANAEDSGKEKKQMETLRQMLQGEHYRISPEQYEANRSNLMSVWNRLQWVFGLVPDAYKFGRDRHVDLLLMRQRDFAQAAMNSVNAAEVQRQGAELILDRVISAGADRLAVDAISQDFLALSEQLVQAEREGNAEKASELRVQIEATRAKLIDIGVRAEVAERVVEYYKNSFAFRHHAAAMLAAQLINDAMFAETIEAGRKLYEAMMRNSALNHLHATFKWEVKEILQALDFAIEVKEMEAKVDQALESKQGEALERVVEATKDRASERTTSKPGSLTAEPARTGAERVLEAVGRGRK